MRVDVSHNGEQLAGILQAYVQKYDPKRIRMLVKVVAFRIWKRLTAECPVDTGRARANFQIDIKYDRNSTVETYSRDTPPMPPPLVNSMVYWIFNNLDYIAALEDGHSKQKPTGFIAHALAEFSKELERQARAMGYIS